MGSAGMITANPWIKLGIEACIGLLLYIGGNMIFGSKIQKDVIAYFRGREIL